MTQTISELTDRLTQEAERFATIQKAIAVVQKELELRKKVAQFPSEIEKAVKEAVAATVTKEKDRAEVAARMAKQAADGQFSLANAKIESLQDVVKSQSAEITRLNRELAEATRQVKDIAIAVAEGQRKEPSPSPGKSTL